MPNTENINIESNEVILTPIEMNTLLPLTKENERAVLAHRKTLENILSGKDKRLFIVVGPCSIHDIKAAKEYASHLKKLAEEVSDTLFLVMRVYFEKPRTTTGWKGLINDPHLNGSFDIVDGLKQARQLMIDLVDEGLPIATEALDPISPQYLADLVSWSAIGARTTESQTHREMASGLSSPIGFKNGTDGSLKVAIDALQAASNPHRFLGINRQGQAAVVHTKGNSFAHIVLRGGGGKPNYEVSTINTCEEKLKDRGLSSTIVIDCSHENSNKKPENQENVFKYCIDQHLKGRQSLVGAMLESNINWGSQKIHEDLSKLKYGVSITDACIDWKTTERIIKEAAKALKDSD